MKFRIDLKRASVLVQRKLSSRVLSMAPSSSLHPPGLRNFPSTRATVSPRWAWFSGTHLHLRQSLIKTFAFPSPSHPPFNVGHMDLKVPFEHGQLVGAQWPRQLPGLDKPPLASNFSDCVLALGERALPLNWSNTRCLNVFRSFYFPKEFPSS